MAALPACLSGCWRAPLVPEEKRVADLYVCGLDLSTGRASSVLLASAFDLKNAREHLDSFDKFYREVSVLLGID